MFLIPHLCIIAINSALYLHLNVIKPACKLHIMVLCHLSGMDACFLTGICFYAFFVYQNSFFALLFHNMICCNYQTCTLCFRSHPIGSSLEGFCEQSLSHWYRQQGECAGFSTGTKVLQKLIFMCVLSNAFFSLLKEVIFTVHNSSPLLSGRGSESRFCDLLVSCFFLSSLWLHLVLLMSYAIFSRFAVI